MRVTEEALRKITEEKTIKEQHVIRGVDNYDKYNYQVGVIHGLLEAENIIMDLLKRLEES
jgi:hypothetical protein